MTLERRRGLHEARGGGASSSGGMKLERGGPESIQRILLNGLVEDERREDAEGAQLLDLLHVGGHEDADGVRPASELVEDGRLSGRRLVTIDQGQVDAREAL